MKKYTVLLTCMGGYGAEYLADNIRRSSIGDQIRFVGTHADPFFLSTSTAEVNYLAPWASKETKKYLQLAKAIVKKEKVDLFIPKSDREVAVVSAHRDQFKCKLFLPEHKEVDASQDKLSFYEIMRKSGVGAAKTFPIKSLGEIGSLMKKLTGDKFWVRVKTPGEAGAITATWVNTAEQAQMWIKLWQEMHGIGLEEFTISEFLPGRLFECLVLFHEGELKIAKIYENIRFYSAELKVSGMASTPGVAKTADDAMAINSLKEAIKAVEAVSKHVKSKPNGIYHLSVKQNAANKPCVTESNIGRFPSTCAFFDRTGKYSVAELYIRYALGLPAKAPKDPFDIDKSDTYIIWSLGKALTLRSKEDVSSSELAAEALAA